MNAVGDQLYQQDPAFIGDAKAGLEGCLQAHAKFSNGNRFNLHISPSGT